MKKDIFQKSTDILGWNVLLTRVPADTLENPDVRIVCSLKFSFPYLLPASLGVLEEGSHDTWAGKWEGHCFVDSQNCQPVV